MKPQQHPSDFGQHAEELVAGVLTAQGWDILARNFRHIGCEIDIVARKQKTTAIIEVKHRRAAGLADVDILLPVRKRRSLARGAQTFLTGHAGDAQLHVVRFDLALVTTDPKTKGLKLTKYWPGVFDEGDL